MELKEKEFEYTDRRLSRGRHTYLVFFSTIGSGLRKFRHRSERGIAAVREIGSEQCGKWSTTSYRVELAHNVCAFKTESDFETGFVFENSSTWEEVQAELADITGVRFAAPVIEKFLRRDFPAEAARFDEAASDHKALSALPEWEQGEDKVKRLQYTVKNLEDKLLNARYELESARRALQKN